jgi:hypothetical protein
MACGILSAMLFYHLRGTAGFPEQITETAEEESAAVTVEIIVPVPVTLDGFMHEDFLGEQTAVFPWTEGIEWQTMPENYIPLFVNGSITDCLSVYMQDGVPMLPVKYVCEALGEEIVSEEEYLPAGVLAELLDAEYDYYSDTERTEKRELTSSDPHMMYNAEHVMIGKYPDTLTAKTPGQMIEFLHEQLIIAYEAHYETAFVPLYEQPEKPYGQDFDRFRISTLSVDDILCETERFYVVPFNWELYIDKYTDEVFLMYNGLANTITRFDFTDRNALSPAG